MSILKINEKSSHYIKIFNSFEELAFLTLPYLRVKTVALSGGRTYKKLFNYWLNFKDALKETEFFPVDERIVPFDNDNSNWGTAYKFFLSKIGRSADKTNFPLTKSQYEQNINHKFNYNLPVFNTVFLSVGDDGHTASLFPNTKELDDLNSLVLQTKSPIPPYERITLGASVIANTENLIVIIAGKSKKRIYREILEAEMNLPIVKILSEYNNAIILVDSDIV